MKKVISIIILLVMFTAVISVKAELGILLEQDSEFLALYYTYTAKDLGERADYNEVWINVDEQTIEIEENNSRIREIYKYPHKQEFITATIIMMYELHFSSEYITLIKDGTKEETKGTNYTTLYKWTKELIMTGGNV